MRSIKWIVIVFLFMACHNQHAKIDTSQIVKGVYFGMDADTFFKHCWDMNQKGETHHGSLDNNVMYVDSLNFSDIVNINFYPKFNEDRKISIMPMKFSYRNWNIWSKEKYSQDKLQKEVVKFFEMKYGEGFNSKEIDENHTGYFKVIGPLTIRVFKDFDEMIVKADLKHKDFVDEK
ncbi:MAG: hypothetical protein AAGK97_11580 [Bacteroidota bacterium]